MSKAIYPSKYTDRKVTDAQYLADEIMERIAKKEKKVLTYRYWNDPQWKKIFLRQLAEANTLLKEVDCVAIMAFLRSVKGRNIYSLGLKKQIIAGAHECMEKYINKIVGSPIYDINDEFISDITDEDIIIESSETKVNMWEKLG